jgi:hypothetical protein
VHAWIQWKGNKALANNSWAQPQIAGPVTTLCSQNDAILLPLVYLYRFPELWAATLFGWLFLRLISWLMLFYCERKTLYHGS